MIQLAENGKADKKNCHHSENYYLFRQLLIASATFIITIVRGYTSGFSTILLPQLKSSTSSIQISLDEESWIASLSLLPMPIGSILGVIFLEKFGRKITLTICCPMYIVSWLILYFAVNVDIMLLGRFMTGITSGAVIVACSIYVAETSNPKYRGLFIISTSLASTCGMLTVHLIGTYLQWTTAALIASILPALSLGILMFIPESPSWLLSKEKVTLAENAFRWCRGWSVEAEHDFLKMKLELSKTNKNKNVFQEQISYFKEKTFLKAISVSIVIVMTAQWSGSNAIEFYSVQLAEQTFPGLNEYLVTIIMDIVRIVFSVISCFISDKFGRRPFFLSTAIASGLCLCTMSLLLYLRRTFIIEPIIVFLFMLLFISINTGGVMSLVPVIDGELYQQKMRSLGNAIGSSVGFLSLFVVVKVGPYMFEGLGLESTYAIYGCACFLGSSILYFILPETKGKSLAELESIFKK